MYAKVLVEISHLFTNKEFTYIIPSSFFGKVFVGSRVKVPFGSQMLEGFVLEINDEFEEKVDLKEISEVIDLYPILNDELLNLGKYISDLTLSPLIVVYQSMLPKALKAKVKVQIKPKYLSYIVLENNVDANNLNNTQKQIVVKLQNDGKVLKKTLNDISTSSVSTLLKKGIIKEVLEEEYRYNLSQGKRDSFVLLPEQKMVYDEIVKCNSSEVFLIHGVTGSGKTNVYIELVDNVIKNGKNAIVLVPEISLTPQMIKRFQTRFDKIAVLHSKLSEGEKYDEWRRIRNGEVKIVIGARSAVFAPLDNLGIIIIDEEHSTTYKQESTPRYHTLDVAKYRSKFHNCPLVLGSATPSLETYARAKKGVYHLLELKNRANSTLPDIEIVDMNSSFKKNNGFFSKQLVDKINEVLSNDEQVILFLNRRGYSSFLTCSDCGDVVKCPHCDISLTYHKSSNVLRCHYCGYATNLGKCHCGGELAQYGMGTEKVEEELSKIIPSAKIVRMDIDTTTTKNAHERIINDFSNKKYNILLGTQMIAKGLDFSDVTLVGVINADTSLNFPDFRSSEYTFQLLCQVSGRSGRGNKKGNVIIQTFNPDHYAIKCSKNHDYISFYNEEMQIRRTLSYPPYYYIVSIRIISPSYEKARDISSKIALYLRGILKDQIILGPSVANVFKVSNKYRFLITIKYKDINKIIEPLRFLKEQYHISKDIKIDIDFNPTKI